MIKKKPALGPKFEIDNAVVTIRYRSNTFVTPSFNKKVTKYVLSCEFQLDKFDTRFLKEHFAALIYIDVKDKMYVGRIGSYSAVVTPNTISFDLTLANLVTKESFDLEHLIPRSFYNDIITNKRFFQRTGKSLDLVVSPLGLCRRVKESDQSLRRRTLEYLNYKMNVKVSEDEINRLIKGTEGDKDTEET